MLWGNTEVVLDVIPCHWFLADIVNDIGFRPALGESRGVSRYSVLIPYGRPFVSDVLHVKRIFQSGTAPVC